MTKKKLDKIIDYAFDACFDWTNCPLKTYKQGEMENDIKQAIREGVKKYIETVLKK